MPPSTATVAIARPKIRVLEAPADPGGRSHRRSLPRRRPRGRRPGATPPDPCRPRCRRRRRAAPASPRRRAATRFDPTRQRRAPSCRRTATGPVPSPARSRRASHRHPGRRPGPGRRRNRGTGSPTARRRAPRRDCRRAIPAGPSHAPAPRSSALPAPAPRPSSVTPLLVDTNTRSPTASGVDAAMCFGNTPHSPTMSNDQSTLPARFAATTSPRFET